MFQLIASWQFARSSFRGRYRPNRPTNQYYELVQYQGIAEDRVAELDAYLEKAYLPALERQGIGQVGVFQETKVTDGKTSLFVLIPLQQAQQMIQIREGLRSDSAYLAASEQYAKTDPKKPIYGRIRSELLIAFDCQPKLAVPKQKLDNRERLFELRIYESANESKGATKVRDV